LFKAPEKNDPKDFAPAVTLLVTKTTKQTRVMVRRFVFKSLSASNLLPFPTIPAWSSVGEPFSETGRESAPPVALLGIETARVFEENVEEEREKREKNEKWD
jgi:hypothetical protein